MTYIIESLFTDQYLQIHSLSEQRYSWMNRDYIHVITHFATKELAVKTIKQLELTNCGIKEAYACNVSSLYE